MFPCFLPAPVTHPPPPCLLGRFVTIYHGPSHTYKLQRLIESSSYSFRIQAISAAGEGPFSDTHTFCTTKSVPPALKGTLSPPLPLPRLGHFHPVYICNPAPDGLKC